MEMLSRPRDGNAYIFAYAMLNGEERILITMRGGRAPNVDMWSGDEHRVAKMGLNGVHNFVDFDRTWSCRCVIDH